MGGASVYIHLQPRLPPELQASVFASTLDPFPWQVSQICCVQSQTFDYFSYKRKIFLRKEIPKLTYTGFSWAELLGMPAGRDWMRQHWVEGKVTLTCSYQRSLSSAAGVVIQVVPNWDQEPWPWSAPRPRPLLGVGCPQKVICVLSHEAAVCTSSHSLGGKLRGSRVCVPSALLDFVRLVLFFRSVVPPSAPFCSMWEFVLLLPLSAFYMSLFPCVIFWVISTDLSCDTRMISLAVSHLHFKSLNCFVCQVLISEVSVLSFKIYIFSLKSRSYLSYGLFSYF